MASTKSKDTPAPSEGLDTEPGTGLGLVGLGVPARPSFLAAVGLGDLEPPPYLNLMYVADPEGARKVEEEYLERVRTAKEDRYFGARLRRRETFALGHEDPWLGRAKDQYKTLGLLLEVLSYEPDDAVRGGVEIPKKLREDATKRVQAFVAANILSPTQTKRAQRVISDKIEIHERRLFLRTLDDFVHKRGAFATLRTAPARMDRLDLFTALLRVYFPGRADVFIAHSRAKSELGRLMEAWPKQVPGKESKWDLAAQVWAKLTRNKPLKRETMRLFWLGLSARRKRARRAKTKGVGG